MNFLFMLGRFIYATVISITLFFSVLSCTFDGEISSKGSDSSSTSIVETDETWTFIVYMAADNSLEASAIDDLNEMESVRLPSNINVLALLDRADGYDSSNGDWTDTRLFHIAYDYYDSNEIVSDRIDCEELGIFRNGESELDMARKNTLSGILSFARRVYPAQHYALIVWGHGTGWRNSSITESLDFGGVRAFALDEGNSASGSYMGISAMREAIETGMGGNKLSFLAFDTCFGASFECAYEFKDCADFMAGTPSIEPENGWDYGAFFSSLSKFGSSPKGIGDAALEQFKKQYSRYIGAAFCVLDLSECSSTLSAFDSFSRCAAESVNSYSLRDSLTEIIQKKTVSYKAPYYPTDFYVDSADFVMKLSNSELFPSLSEDIAFRDMTSFVLESFERLVYSSWSASSGRCSPGVFYATFKADGVVASSHPDLYVNGNVNPDVSLFVSDCSWYVPTKSRKGSLIDRIFYTFFEEEF